MIADPLLLQARHHLSPAQIERHFGLACPPGLSLPPERFQTLDAFLRVVDLLAAAGIRFIPLKGPVLSDLLYGDPAARRFHDLDFLIDAGDMERAIAAVAALGYLPDEEVPADAAGWAALFATGHHVLCRHRSDRTDLELHWRFFSGHGFPNKGFEELYRHETVPHVLAGRSLRKLVSEIELAFILAHGAKHRWFRLKWLVDVNDYLGAVALDLATVERILGENGMASTAAHYNAAASALLRDPVTLPFPRRRPSRLLRHAALVPILMPPSGGSGRRTLRQRFVNLHGEVFLDFLLKPGLRTAARLAGAVPRALYWKLRRWRDASGAGAPVAEP